MIWLFRSIELYMVFVMLSGMPREVCSIRCYLCKTEESNHMCISDFNLQVCDSFRYDTCQTVVAYSDVSEKLSITKSCATNTSCLLQQKGTPKTPCVKTNAVWVCTTCCHSDSCNYSYANTLFPGSRTCLLISAIAILHTLLPASH